MSTEDAQKQLEQNASDTMANLESQLESLLASSAEQQQQAGADEAASTGTAIVAEAGDNDNHSAANAEPSLLKSTKDAKSKSSKKAAGGASGTSSRSFDYVMRSLEKLSPDEKLEALAKKYAEIYDQGRASAEKLKTTQKQLSTVSRERDQLQSEHSKAMLAKSKLEGLCRELQKHNKVVKDESINRAKEEEEKRKEVSGQLQTTISDIQSQMQEHNVRNAKLREENNTLVEKMKGLVEKYEKREEYVEKLLRQHDLQTQLAEARLAQEKAQGEAERTRMSDEIRQLTAQVDIYVKQEKALNDQISFYTAKYEDFQTAIGKSNEMFATFKTQIDGLTKKMRQLEKERNQWRERCEASGNSVLQMAQDKAEKEALIAGLRVKIDTLEKLCRALQLERRARREDSAESNRVEEGQTKTCSAEDGITKTDSDAAEPAAETKTDVASDLQETDGTKTNAAELEETDGTKTNAAEVEETDRTKTNAAEVEETDGTKTNASEAATDESWGSHCESQ